MDSRKMNVFVKDGLLQETIMLEVDSSATLSDLQKKLAEKGVKTDHSNKFISNGKILRPTMLLALQGIESGSLIYPVGRNGMMN